MASWHSDPVAQEIEQKRKAIREILGVDPYDCPTLIEYILCSICGLKATAPREKTDGLHKTGAKIEIKYCSPIKSAFKFKWRISGKHVETDIFILVGRYRPKLRGHYIRDELMFFVVPKVYASLNETISYQIAPDQQKISHLIMQILEVSPCKLQEVVDKMCNEAVRSRQRGEVFQGPIPPELIEQLDIRKTMSGLFPGFLSRR